VLADDNFASIAAAVEEGRTVFANLRKFIVFALPTNGGEAGVILMAIAMGIALPITAAQVLWVNMVTAVTLGLALAFEPAEAGVMARPPRPPQEPILSRFLVWRIAFVSLTLAGGIGALFLWEAGRGMSLEASRTIAVNALVIAEIAYLFNCRSLTGSAFRRGTFTGNRAAVWAVGVLVVLQAAFTYLPPMNAAFGTSGLDAAAWARVLAFGAFLFFLVEAEKALMRGIRRPGADSAPSAGKSAPP
jgi:magnesium-transporting ATPase (P-type)